MVHSSHSKGKKRVQTAEIPKQKSQTLKMKQIYKVENM
jgi:hypothetical protein